MRSAHGRSWVGFVSCAAILLSFLSCNPVSAESTDITVGVGDTILVVEGETSPSALVTIIDNDVVIGSITADSAGAYSQQFTAQAPGLHDLEVHAKDREGRESNAVHLQVNLAEHAQTVIDLFLPPTIQLSTTSVSKGQSITLSGETAPGANVFLYIRDDHLTTQADGAGYWKYILPITSLEAGEYGIYAIAQISNGDQSYPTGIQTFKVLAEGPLTVPNPDQTTGGSPGTVAVASKLRVPAVLRPKSGTSTNESPIVVSGTANPGTRVEVWNNGKIAGSVFATGAGEWSLSIQLSEGANSIKTRSCRDTICSDFSRPVIVFYTARATGELRVTLDNYALTGETVTLKLNLEGGKPPYAIVIEWGDGSRQEATITKNMHPSFKHAYRTSGHFNGKVLVVDADSRQAVAHFTASVSHKIAVPTWVVAVVSGAAVIALATFVIVKRYWLLERLTRLKR